MSETPPLNGSNRMAFKKLDRLSRRSWTTSASAFFAATTAPIYLMKSIPHFSHLPPARWRLPQEGHSKRSVVWHRGQKRATSRASVPHFGHLYVAEAEAGRSE